MHYFVRRGGEEYGPYTLADLRRFCLSGHLMPPDGVRESPGERLTRAGELLGEAAWLSPAQGNPPPGAYLPAYQIPRMANGAPLPPSLHWGLVLLLSFISCGFFAMVWVLMQAWWVRQLDPKSKAIWYLAGSMIVAYIPTAFISVLEPILEASSPRGDTMPAGIVIFLVFLVIAIGTSLSLWMAAILSMFASMDNYFNQIENIGLRLNMFLTILFGFFYLQYHMTRIHLWKNTGVLA